MIEKILKDPVYTLKMLRIRTGKIFGSDKYRKFIVLTRNRSGSNMLISMLNSHPSVYAEYEIFRQLGGVGVDDILSKIYSPFPKFIQAVGFKIFYHHPVDDKSGYVWERLIKMENLCIIHLKRRNILRAVLSKRIAELSNTWVDKNKNKDGTFNKKVYLGEEELISAFERTKGWEQEYRLKFHSHPFVEVFYEDIVAAPDQEFNKITDLLQLPFVSPKTTLQKQNPEKMCDLILNYKEIKEIFKNTEWAHFFEE